MRVERLNKNNREIISKSILKSKIVNPLNEDFLIEYDRKPFFAKLILKYSFDIFAIDEQIGFIWYETLKDNLINIKSLYFPSDFSKLPLDFFKKNKYYTYESIANEECIALLRELDFNVYSESYILEKYINDSIMNYINNDIEFKQIIDKNDINTRIFLQNQIFEDDSRIPLEQSDILFDMKQNYYVEDLAILMYFKETPIGYGQIIYNNQSYIVVNFGILKEYRNKGLGKYFLNHLIELAKDKEINTLTIRVSSQNVKAMNLYHSVGFYYKEHILTWSR